MTLQSKIFLNLDYRVVENEFNKFLAENELKKDQIVRATFENNIIFLVWEDNKPSLQQLNRGIDTSKDSEHYIASGCE
jgi:hypothetical protein